MSAAARAELAMEALAPSYQFRADTVTLSGGNVATIPNRRGADALTVPIGTVAAPSANSAFGGAQTLALANACLRSNLPASAWNVLHKGDGTGYEFFLIGRRTGETGGNQALVTTRAGGGDPGFLLFTTNGTATAGGFASNNAGTAIYSVGTTLLDWATNTPVYLNFTHQQTDPQPLLAFSKEAVRAGLTPTTPGTNDAAGTLQIGNIGSGTTNLQPATMDFAELLVFPRRLHEYERQVVREYIAARYGIAAPSLTGVDRDIMSMLPFSWTRFDNYTTLGGNVTAILDKARPGHTFAQSTVGNQVLNPVSSANFNGQFAATFGANKTYLSSLPAAAWTFVGPLEGTFFCPLRSTSFASIQIMFESWNGGGGMSSSLSTAGPGNYGSAVYRPTSGAGAAALTGNAINVPRLYQTTFAPLLAENKATGMGASQAAIAIGSTNPTTKTMSYSGRSGSFFVVGEVPELGLIFNRALTVSERERVEAYYLSRYNLAA